MRLKNLIIPPKKVISENTTDLMDYYRMVTPIQAGVMKKVANGILPENLSTAMEDALADLIELKLITTDGDFLTHMGKDVLVVINDQGSYKLFNARDNKRVDDPRSDLDDIGNDIDPNTAGNDNSDDYIEIA